MYSTGYYWQRRNRRRSWRFSLFHRRHRTKWRGSPPSSNCWPRTPRNAPLTSVQPRARISPTL